MSFARDEKYDKYSIDLMKENDLLKERKEREKHYFRCNAILRSNYYAHAAERNMQSCYIRGTL